MTHKSRVLSHGYKKYGVSPHITYTSVVSRESVRIIFLLTALNNIEVFPADIVGAHLNTPHKEKVHITTGPKLFGRKYEGRTTIVVQALYRLNSFIAVWRSHLNSTLYDIGYKLSFIDINI